MASTQSLLRAEQLAVWPSPSLRSSAQTVEAGELVIFQPDPAGPIRFRIEAQLLRLVLADLEPTIEHIGSTAVAELAAKPIIDILVSVPSLQRFAPGAGRLANYGYEYVPTYEATQPERRFFKRVVEGVRTHHRHVIEVGSKDRNRYLSFRNRLRTDAPLAQSYAQLKYRPPCVTATTVTPTPRARQISSNRR